MFSAAAAAAPVYSIAYSTAGAHALLLTIIIRPTAIIMFPIVYIYALD